LRDIRKKHDECCLAAALLDRAVRTATIGNPKNLIGCRPYLYCIASRS
jgi:hypothetical protein